METFEDLTPQELEALKRDCRKLSDESIWLVPGFTSENFIGMKNYYISPDLPYPKKNMLRPDGKGWGDGSPYANYKRPGQLNQLRQTYVWSLCAVKVVLGYYDFTNLPVPHNDCGIYDTVPVMTARGERLVEDSLHVYLNACRDKQFPHPIGLHFLTNPGQLRSERLVKTKAIFAHLSEFKTWFADQNLGARFLCPAALWVTNGPKILAWERLGGHDYRLRNPHEFVWQNALNKIRLKARSDAGLRAVKVWDGDDLFRRFAPDSNEFETVIHIDKRDQQRELILEVIDNSGRRAIGSRHLTKNHALQQVNCGDRNNQLAGSHWRRRSDGSVLMLSGIPATPDKRCSQMFCCPSNVFKQDVKLGTGAFDGVARYAGYPAMREALLLHVKDAWHKFDKDQQFMTQTRWSSEENGSHQLSISTFSSMDVIVGDRIVENVFDDQVDVIHVWNTLWRLKPRNYSTWTQRRFVFRTRQDRPLAFNLWRYRVTLKQDVEYEEDAPLGVDAIRMSEGGSRFWSLGPVGPFLDPVVQGSYEEPSARAPAVAGFGPGAWAAFTGSPGGGQIVFGLSRNLKIACAKGRRTKPFFSIGLDPEGSPKRAGEETELWLLVVGIPRYCEGYSDEVAVPDPVAVARAIKSGLGIGCQPSYRVQWTRGETAASDFLCRVRAVNGAVVGRFEEAPGLIAPIPVWIDGTNPNWTVMLHERRANNVRAVGQFEGQAIVMVDPYYGDQDLFVGHPVVADARDLVIHVVQVGDDRWNVELHNPTTKSIKTGCRTDRDWRVFEVDRRVTIEAGNSLSFEVERR